MNICTRCGKERIVSDSYAEMVAGSRITYTTTVCPDPKCQKIVEEKLKIEEDRRKLFREGQERNKLNYMSYRKNN